MSIKITIPNSSSDVLTFGSGNTPTAAQIAGIDSGSSNGQLALYTTASGTSTERVRVDASGNVGIGTSSPSTTLTVDNKGGASTATSGGVRVTQTGWTGSYGYLEFDTVNTVFKLGATSTSFPLSFQTNSAERMRIDTSGNVLVTSPAGLGYGTGSGGTVTQATSKTTGVTLNKPTGQITMNNAALAANTAVAFDVTNSTVAATDTVVISQQSGGTLGAYTFGINRVSAGSFAIFLRNLTAGSLSEVVIFNFAVIKGVTS